MHFASMRRYNNAQRGDSCKTVYVCFEELAAVGPLAEQQVGVMVPPVEQIILNETPVEQAILQIRGGVPLHCVRRATSSVGRRTDCTRRRRRRCAPVRPQGERTVAVGAHARVCVCCMMIPVLAMVEMNFKYVLGAR